MNWSMIKDMIADIYGGTVALIYLAIFLFLLYLGCNALYHWALRIIS